MKQFSYYRLVLLFLLSFFTVYMKAEFLAVPGVRVWNLIAELGYETNTILSKLCVIESIIEHQINCCSEVAAIDSKIHIIESLVENATNCCSEVAAIDSKVDVITSLFENPTNCCSEVAVIDSKIDVITSLVENPTNCCSEAAVIDSKIDVITSLVENSTNCCSEIAVIDSKIDALEEILNNLDNGAFVSIYGDQIAEQRLDNISVQFQYGIPATTVQSYTQGGGTVTTSSSRAILSTAASATSIAQLQTKNTIGYRSGHEAYAYFTVAFTGSFTATSSQFIGPIDYQNGFAVGFDGATFGVTRRVNTVNTFTPQSSFNGDELDGTGESGFTYNPALLNVFRIGYGYLGSSVIKFQIMNSNGAWITFHTIEYPNSAATPSINQPFLPITARVENIAGTSVLSMSTVSWNAGIVGHANSSSYRYFATNNSLGGGADTHMLTIRNSTVFNNQRNVIQVRIVGLSVSGTTINAVTYRLRKNATVTGTSYSNIDANNSVVQVSTAGTYIGGTGTSVLVTAGQESSAIFIPPTYNIYLLPGETLTVTGTSGGITIDALLMWEEQF